MALNPLVALFGRLVARSARIRGTGRMDGRTDRPSTVTLAAHARRGLNHDAVVVMACRTSHHGYVYMYVIQRSFMRSARRQALP